MHVHASKAVTQTAQTAQKKKKKFVQSLLGRQPQMTLNCWLRKLAKVGLQGDTHTNAEPSALSKTENGGSGWRRKRGRSGHSNN